MDVTLRGYTYPIEGDSRYATVYWRYGYREGVAEYDTAEAAAYSLEYGEEYGQFSAIGIYDTKDKKWLAQNDDETVEGYTEGFDWPRAVALEVPVRVVGENDEDRDKG